MTEAQTTPLSLAWIGPDGARRPLGRGRIGPDGAIAVEAPAPGLSDWLADAVGRLNAREELSVMEPAPGLPPEAHAVRGRRILRGSPEFLDELPGWARNNLAIELVFDASAFDAWFARPVPFEEGPAAAPAPDAIPPRPEDDLADISDYDLDPAAPADGEEDDPDEEDDDVPPVMFPQGARD